MELNSLLVLSHRKLIRGDHTSIMGLVGSWHNCSYEGLYAAHNSQEKRW